MWRVAVPALPLTRIFSRMADLPLWVEPSTPTHSSRYWYSTFLSDWPAESLTNTVKLKSCPRLARSGAATVTVCSWSDAQPRHPGCSAAHRATIVHIPVLFIIVLSVLLTQDRD